MIYLVGQIFFCLALVAMVGLLVGWLVRGIGTHQREKELEATWRMRMRQRDTMLSKMANELAERDAAQTGRPVDSSQLGREVVKLRNTLRERDAQLAQLQGQVSKRDAQISQLVKEFRRVGGQSAASKLLAQLNTGRFQASELAAQRPAAKAAAAVPEDDPSERTHPEKISLERASAPAASDADELVFIYGISPALEKKLVKLGITSFRQIAGFGDQDIERIATAIGIEAAQIIEDNWVEGARQEHLAKYGELV